MGSKFAAFALAALVLPGCFPALAQGATDWDLKRHWDITLGGGVSLEPTYEGSNNLRPLAVPYFDIEWNDRFSLSSDDGAHFAVVRWKDLSIGLAGNARLPRRSKDDRTLLNVHSVGVSIEAGGYIDYNPKGIDVSLEVRHDLAGGHGGTIAEFNLRGQVQLGKRFGFEFGPNVTWADGTYMRSYFGITSGDAARSGYQKFTPDAGIKDFGFTINAGYSFDDHWRVLGQAQYSRLVDDAAESPIVKGRGSRNQFEFDLLLAYHF